MPIPAAIAAGIGIAQVGSQLLGAFGDMDVANKNYELQKQQLEYQKGLQDRVFAREDTSIQRRVADLKAAGLSPVLAAGQGAQAGAVVSTQAPQLNLKPSESIARVSASIGTALQLQQMEAGIEQSRAQTRLINAQADVASRTVEENVLGKQLANQMTQTSMSSMEADIVGKKIQNAISELTQNERVQSVIAGLDGQRLDNSNKAMDYIIKRLQEEGLRLENAYDTIRNSFAKDSFASSLDSSRQDVLVKMAALASADIANASARVDLRMKENFERALNKMGVDKNTLSLIMEIIRSTK